MDINNLIPEVKELLENDKEKFPNLFKKITREITEAFTPQDLSVSTASVLNGYFDTTGLKAEHDDFVIKLYNVFGK
jgi:hypothetical protein